MRSGFVTIRQGRGVTMTARESATHTRSSGGWVARREAAVRVLTDLAGLSTVDLTGLTAADVTVLDGAATISTPTRTVTVPPATGGMCGPCTLARWLHTLDLTVVHTDPLVVTAVITRAAAPTPGRGLSCNRHHRPGYPATAAATLGGPMGTATNSPPTLGSVTGEYTRTPR